MSMTDTLQDEREGGLVVEFRCLDCDRTEKLTIPGWTGEERVYAAICEECASPVAAAAR